VRVRITQAGRRALGAGEMSLDERVKAVLEFLKIAAWPLLIFWLVLYFRDEVKRAITRITELGLTGAKFAPPTEQVATPPPKGVSSAAPSTQSSSGGSAPASAQLGSVQQFIDRMKRFIPADQLDLSVQAVRNDLKTLSADPAAQVEALTYSVASLNIQVAYERSYRIIFGSQLRLMQLMNVDIGVPPDVAKGVYDTAKTAYPEFYRSYTFEQWIWFLQGTGLITIAPNGNYVLSAYGRGLLKYILDQHLATSKPF
jgi:hypothetical protein